ncbi:methyltransferase domain-containing protein, partial [Mesorhizobium sp. M1C.F.Ca.ET.204.01.1.1]|uniref:methyltransferase domain-containing protein n=1 Tax=Mesorhizobium sp. M1C.F.Ca.ET.204.01.1.1 TaxID=2563929 RepID=UPI001093D523
RFGKAAALFCQTSAAAEVLASSGKVGEILRVEMDEAFLAGRPGLVVPPETVPFEDASLDLAVSLLSLHAMNDFPGVLAQIRRALKPDGLFLGARGKGVMSMTPT